MSRTVEVQGIVLDLLAQVRPQGFQVGNGLWLLHDGDRCQGPEPVAGLSAMKLGGAQYDATDPWTLLTAINPIARPCAAGLVLMMDLAEGDREAFVQVRGFMAVQRSGTVVLLLDYSDQRKPTMTIRPASCGYKNNPAILSLATQLRTLMFLWNNFTIGAYQP